MSAFIFSEQALADNYRKLAALADKSCVIAVVKCDGYGLGLLPAAQALQQAGCSMLALAEPGDALALRREGIKAEILLLTPVYEEEWLRALIREGVTLSLTSAEGILRTQIVAQLLGQMAKVQVCLDTGMGRHGLSPAEMDRWLRALKGSKGLEILGTWSHLSGSGSRARKQWEVFCRVCGEMQRYGIDPGMRHVASSASFFAHPEMRMDAVRLGTALLGRGRAAREAGLAEVGRLCGRVEDVYDRPRGSRIGYGRGFSLRRDTRIAVVNIGYRDGFGLQTQTAWRSRLFPKALTVEIQGTACPVLGRPCCSSCMVDVTDVPQVQRGDAVTAVVNPLLTRSSQQ